MSKKILLAIIIIVVGGGLLGGLFFWNQISWAVGSDEREVLFEITEGEGVKEIAANLTEQNMIRSTFWFETYIFLNRSEADFIAGNYVIQATMNIRDIVAVLTAGDASPEVSITLIEGWTVRDIAEYLEDEGIVTADDFLGTAQTSDSRNIISNKTYSTLVDKPTDYGFEGYLFPDTYRIFDDSSSADIIERMLDNFEQKFTQEMIDTSTARGMSIFEIVTLASIIEKEVRTDVDRKIAAGIFYDRMATGVALQSDATINYVTGKQALQPTLEDLDSESLYNTYKHRGLPPGPISNPSLASLLAAVYPASTEYFYFLTKPDGTTVFSVTYDEHLENKALYLQ